MKFKLRRSEILITKKTVNSKKELTILGGRWDSNPRPSEPQSDALTN